MRKFIALTILCALFPVASFAEEFVVTFINKTGELHRGCALMAWKKSGERVMDGVHPVEGNATVQFRLHDCAQYTHWRFIASVDYSDEPDNLKVVLVDTGKRPITKCTYEITGTKGN